MDSPRVLLSHPTGNQNVRNAVLSLVEAGMLAEFWTTVAWNPQRAWNRLLPSRIATLLQRRAYRDVPWECIRATPWREMVRLAAGLTPQGRSLTFAEGPFSIFGVYRSFDGKVARRLGSLRPDAVYCYEGGALETFREARQRGIPTIYELTSSYWHWVRDLLNREAARRPDLVELLPSLADSEEHLRRKDEELALADMVVVASDHVRRTLEGAVAGDTIRVVHYGAPEPRPRQPQPADPARPLRVLFVGALVQHKGIGDLLDAVDGMGSRVELTLVGRRFRPNARVDAACRRWRWRESLAHDEVLNWMLQSDVLVLPSLGEGFGLVVTEALACGLPVIVTPHVGASDLIRDGQEGFVVPIGSADTIAERLRALDGDRALLAAMSRRAQAAAAANSWASYRVNLQKTIRAAIAWQQ